MFFHMLLLILLALTQVKYVLLFSNAIDLMSEGKQFTKQDMILHTAYM